MQLYSTYESSKKGKVSVLAIIETIASTGITLWLISLGISSWTLFGISILVSPLIFMRTKISEDYGERFGNQEGIISGHPTFLYSNTVTFLILGIWWLLVNNGPPSHFSDTLIVFACIWFLYMNFFSSDKISALILDSILIRILGFFFSILQDPLQAIKSIPNNFNRICFCTDMAHPLVLFPRNSSPIGSDDGIKEFYLSGLIYSSSVSSMLKRKKLFGKIILMVELVPLFIQSLLYRYAAKSTSMVWLPLVWVLRKTFKNHKPDPRENLISQAEFKAKGLGLFMTLVSMLTIILFATKIFIFSFLDKSQTLWSTLPFGDEIVEFVAPYHLPIWQLASFVGAVISVILFFWSWRLLIENNNDLLGNNSKINGKALVMRIGIAVHTILGIYSATCLVYIVFQKGLAVNWPPIGDRIFPWL